MSECAYFLRMSKRYLAAVLSACLATLTLQPAAADPARAELGEFPTESRALVEATAAFFDRVEARAKPQKRVPVIGIPLSVTKSSIASRAQDTETLTRMGPVDHLTGYRITWYPMDNLYGTVDFMGTWNGNRNLVCGYLTWDLSDPEAPVLQTVTANFVDLAALGGASRTDIHQSLLEANCAYGAIDANYRLFEPTG